MLALILCAVSCFLYAWYQWESNYRRLKSYKLPPMYPGVLPIIGHAHLLIGNTTRLWTMVQKLAKQALDNGGVISGFIGKDLYYRPTWKRHRKLLNPAFSLQVLHSFLGVFNIQARRQVNHFEAEVGRGKFDHLASLKHIALETVCLTAFGITADEDKDFNKLYMAAVDQILNIIAMRFSNFWLQSDLIYNFTELRKKQDEVVKVLNAMSTAVIKRKKEQMKSLPREEWEAQRQRTGIKCKALMDLLLELAEENTLTDKEIREEVDTAIVASYDTTSCLLAYIMMILEEIFEGTDRDVTKDDLPRMVYTDAVIKETLRLIPTGPVGLRYVDKDVQLRRTFATLSMKTTLSHVLRRFKIKADINDLKLKIDFLLKPVSGSLVSLERRN
ncbi:hypothetical protein HF086_011300 [Spodoptera exigua]|uniref:Cytochrome p450 n=1 Tax=Spodoptera exigua TaxID=7107 RepID=A0A922MGQ2_SPOEX|nr:hypothetical protein HF086_011300 [Spodoptera exigua]